ncbi:MAG: 2-hydroxyhepta-2,4-diene-1,7-dioate isomerase [Bacteroidetes bacterium HGW-Bacteroidetes-17]|jgi:2-keto-4-pentenoate hydratase/2-oxohepta-3-ene-1,7-dioic acid hydratase in catechol pathway|nr:MAG: 2-hydroxyhepta-2,4-diene-1,7-dioate isomerase [Bacteroidetes bacterium HGW-Bacteroidetes-17]
MKIICIGRNYVEHAIELNNPLPKKPIFFLKPESAVVLKNQPFYYPEFSKDIHYETEIVLKICKVGKHIQPEFAHTYFDEIGIGFDLTARDLQNECKAKGLPWEMAKAFDQSAPLGLFKPKSAYKNMNDIAFSLKVNKEIKQQGNTRDLIFSFDHLISYVSQFITLKIGDLIFTGTPEGVGPVHIGDHLEAYIEDEKCLDLKVK